MGVFRKKEGDWSGSGMEELGGHSCLPRLARGLGRVGKGRKARPRLGGCRVFQEGPGLHMKGKVKRSGVLLKIFHGMLKRV